MRLRPFGLSEPETVADAIVALADQDGDARLVAGGTAVVPLIRLGLLAPERLISLQRVTALRGIRPAGTGLAVGAMATYAEVERDPAVRAGWPLLADCAARVASPAIRSMGTVGGNLAYAEAASDLSPALLCLDAEVRIAGPAGERGLAVADLFRGFYESALEPGEIITALRLPALAPGMRGAYAKFCSRSADDKPLVGVAAIVRLEGTPPRCEDIRIALAGVAPTPIRGRRAERAIRGERLDDAAIAAAADAAAAEADPVSDLMGSAEYRRRMTRVWVRRVLAALRDRRERP